jgi:serine/threonine-protein kinase
VSRFIDRLQSALTDFAKGWGISGEVESDVPAVIGDPDEILPIITGALKDQYSVEEQIGFGGMALVFLARDLKHDRHVAIKVLRPELASQVGRERFLQEIRLAAQLSHPHILPLHDSGMAGGLLYYVMPYVEGETLRERLDREGRLTLEEAVDITRAVAGALDFAHRQGVVHRDIKPENIMVHDGVALVTDFGISKVLSEVGGEQLTQAGTAMGTPAYMSPEQIFGEEDVDGRSDVYSLALVVFELLSGNRLFTGPSARAIRARL